MMLRRVALISALLASACGGKETAIAVTMNIDADSCSTGFPEDVNLSCPTAVGLALWGGESEERLASSCLDLPGTERTLEALPIVLAEAQLSTSADEPVRLELGVFAPRSASDGCPDVGASESDMLIYGESEPTDLSAISRGMSIDIVCVGVTIGEWEACAVVCDDGYNSCIEQGYCSEVYDACVAACGGDADCAATCQTNLESCMVDECSAARNACLAECSGESGCDARCDDEHDLCLQYGACDGRYETCLLDCDAAEADDCAFVY